MRHRDPDDAIVGRRSQTIAAYPYGGLRYVAGARGDIPTMRLQDGNDMISDSERPEREDREATKADHDWLLASDPSIRWQVMRDLTDMPAETIAAERARVAEEGWGRRLLDLQRADGQWGDGVATPFWWSNLYTLVFLRDLGVDPSHPRVRAAVDRVRTRVSWAAEFGSPPFFD